MRSAGVKQQWGAMAFPRIFSVHAAIIGIVYLLGYLALDRVSLIGPLAQYGITPWNPHTGLSFVLVLLFGQRFIPLLFAAPLLAGVLGRHLSFPLGVQLPTMLIIGSGYAAGVLFLLTPRTRFNPALATMRDLIMLMLVAAACSIFVALSYVSVLTASGVLPLADFSEAVLELWIGDMIGVAVVVPFALILLTRGHTLRPSVEMGIQILTILSLLLVMFVFAGRYHFQLFYALFLPIVWMAARKGLEGVTIGILLTQIGLIVGTQLLPQSTTSVTEFQFFMLVLTTTGLVAGALVTERRRTEFQLRLHQESLARLARVGSLGEMAAAIAHEINQPLMAAGTYARLVADMARTGTSHDPALLATADKSVAQMERAGEVIRRLRALIRRDQSGRAPVAVTRLVSETIELCQPELTRHNVTIRIEIAPNLPLVLVDLLQMEQVLLNLVRNGIEAMSDAGRVHGTITIQAAMTNSDFIDIQVRDTGPGFPAELAAAKFPPFTTTKAEGLGIGLSLARSIVEAHGGRLETGGDSTGAVVTIALPIAKQTSD